MNTLLGWFARNSVAANLLMGLIILGGVTHMASVRQEVFPYIPSNVIAVTMVYPGAAPEEVETAICSPIEDKVHDLELVKRVRSVAIESLGTVTIELVEGAVALDVLNEIKARVDTIESFPEEAEKPTFQEISLLQQVVNVAISGQADEMTLKRLGEQVRDEIAALDSVSRVALATNRPYEISIEVSEKALRRHALSFDQVAEAVRRSSLDLPGGSIKGRNREILLRAKGQAYRQRDFEEIILHSDADGTLLTLKEVATIVDGFAETEQSARFDGLPAVVVQVFRVGDQHDTTVSDRVRAYVEQAQPRMPAGIQLTVWQDEAQQLRGRLGSLLRNSRSGLLLVIIVLALFLKPRLAGWVALGIPVSFLGTLWMMPRYDLSINLMSITAFLIVLGIVVDDAVVVGENIYRHHEMGKEGLAAALDGVREVAMPVVFGVLTTFAAVAPLTTIPGTIGQALRVFPLIVILTLSISLVESLLILPSHLSHLHHRPRSRTSESTSAWGNLRNWSASFSRRIVERIYRPILRRALAWRYTTVAIACAALLLTLGFVVGGHLRFSLLPPTEADNIVVFLTMPHGTPSEKTAAALDRIEQSAWELQRQVSEEGEPKAFRHLMTSIGSQPFRGSQSQSSGGGTMSVVGSHLGEVNIELSSADHRQVSSSELVRRWRELTGPIPEAVLNFNSSLFTAGAAIDIQLSGQDLEGLRQAAAELKVALSQYPGVLDIADSFRAGKDEVRLAITPEAQSLGLSLSDLARQVRQAFYGEEAQRIQRGRDEVKVMVRYPADERRSLSHLERMRIRTPNGDEVPFAVVGRMETGRGLVSIEHTARKRTVNVTAAVEPSVANSNVILADLRHTVLPELLAKYEGLSHSLEGEQRQQQESLGGLGRGFLLAVFIIFALLAILFRSYVQPLVVMSVIPFGILGAFCGHVLMGKDLSVNSLLGMVALTGVVVNDSLVLVSFANRACSSGTPLFEAVLQASEQRFRPVLLTSLTTFMGLTPLLLETSLQGQFLRPLAISLGFGVLFAALVILLLVPASYCILEDFRAFSRRAIPGRDRSQSETGQEA